MKKFLVFLILIVLSTSVVVSYFVFGQKKITIPLVTKPEPEQLPLLQYSIENLRGREYQTSQITIEKLVKIEPSFASFTFSYETLHKKMTGLMNVPLNSQTADSLPVLVLVRGYIPPANYAPGAGTKNAGEYFAQHGYITLAPDFFGFGGSDKESSDEWEARFQKPINVVELLKTVTFSESITVPDDILSSKPQLPTHIQVNRNQIGLWAHSNGGQITLTALEIGSFPFPSTFWAPVTAPFPYSVLYFSDEEADEGKASRKWISQFDAKYDALAFSMPQHINLLKGPIQIHQGVADEAIHYIWSDEFVDKLRTENTRRKKQATAEATVSAELQSTLPLQPIEVTYYRYPGSNHNMQPDWSTVIQRDLEFFDKNVRGL